MTLRLRIAVALGIESLVADELRSYGYEEFTTDNGSISLSGTFEDLARLSVRLRCAERLQIEIGRFPAPDFDALFEGTKNLPWEEWISREGAFPVKGRTAHSQLQSVRGMQSCVKKAIVERLMARLKTSELPESGEEYPVEVSCVSNQAVLTIDCSGGLHKRGYRQEGQLAPLRETLAAALVLLSDWDPETPLVDPFCGSGTILIEAAMIARRIAPGAARQALSESWPCVPAKLWAAAREEAKAYEIRDGTLRIYGSDIDERVLASARRNAERAGVAGDIELRTVPAAKVLLPAEKGALISNPPYGVRIGTEDDAREAAENLRSLVGANRDWSLYIVTADPEFERQFGWRAHRKRKLFNGGLRVDYYQYPHA